jgi:WD40 repeat protein
MLSRRLALCLLVLFWFPRTLNAQRNCPLPPSLQPTSSAENIFSDAQEVDLGDAMAQTVALHVNVIQNDELTAHLREIGNRLIQHLPPTQLKFRFYLIDLPEVNAFSIAGGRVYVSRKVVAFSQSDDELAGILAHELGHIVTHQSAIEMTRAFREVLGVTQVSDRDDVFKKFHQYIENVARHPRRGHGEGEKQQIVADQVGLFTLARAGFAPQAAADMWDRFTGLHGKTGGWLSDLFGATTSEQHRLREMVKNMAALPPGCADHTAPSDDATFKTWQEAVVDYDSARGSESLPSLISKHRLSSRLLPDLTNLRFSPDGKYILAQDDGGISVVSRDPLAFLFYIPAPNARDARFSPDSASIVFFNSGLRAEVWSVSGQKRKSVHEITLREPCLQSDLSPDGSTLACLNSEFALQLVDVNTSALIHERKGFWVPSFWDMFSLFVGQLAEREEGEDLESPAFHFVDMGFSPDGRYFLAGHDLSCLLFDLANHRELAVPGSIKDLAAVSFAFLGADRIVGINVFDPQKSHVLKFPSGEKVEDVYFGSRTRLRAATHGDYIFFGPVKDYALAIMDLGARETRITIKQNAVDMYDGVFVMEHMNGELALHTKDSAQPLSVLKLPESSLGRLRAAAVSPDLDYLAASSRSRAAVWDVSHDVRAFYTRRFSAAGFDRHSVYADFPKFQDTPREVAELRLDTGSAGFREIKDDIALQHGLYLVITKPRNKNGFTRANADMEVRDIRSGQTIWSRYFSSDLPSVSFNPQGATTLLTWRLYLAGGHDELHRFPELKSRAEKDDYLCEVLDANSGILLATFIVKTNSGSLRNLRGDASRNWAVMEATGNQILTYALPSGEEKGHFFGSRPILSSSGLLAMDSEKREVSLYDLSTSQLRQQYIFAQPVAFKAFSGDGKRMLVFTSDQTVYILDMTAAPANAEPPLASNPAN